MRTHVDLFSGIGGFSLACQWAGVETIAFAEIDPYARRVLNRRFPGIRNYGDVREFPRHSAWLLTAGVPCQPASVAGKRKGADDDRWLWPQTLAVVENGSYEWLLFENPTGILSLNDGLEFERICTSLESKGYKVQPLVIPACAIGALHRRDRCWIIAHADGDGCNGRDNFRGGSILRDGQRNAAPNQSRQQERIFGTRSVSSVSADPQLNRLQGELRQDSIQATGASKALSAGELPVTRFEQLPQPYTVGSLDGIPDGAHRIRRLGNAIVPQVAYQIIKRMIEAESHVV